MDADKNVGASSAKHSADISRAVGAAICAVIAPTISDSITSLSIRLSVVFIAAVIDIAIEKTRPQEKKVFSLNDDVDTSKRQRDELQQQHDTDRQTPTGKEQQLKQALMRNEQLQQTLMSKEQQLQRVTRDKERLKTEYRRVREANKVYSTCVRSMKKKSVHLINQRDADKMEIKRLKEQIASLSTEITCLYAMSRDIINNIHFEDMADHDGAEGDTDVSRHFHYIKENVTTEWKDLAYQLGFTRPDIDTIDERNRDYKSRCLDMLGEWQKRRGKAATLTALMEALRELGLTSVVDGLKSKYPGSLLSTQCSG